MLPIVLLQMSYLVKEIILYMYTSPPSKLHGAFKIQVTCKEGRLRKLGRKGKYSQK